MSQEKCTIQAAAKALGVTTKTIYRYLSNGSLSKVKEGARTYILIDEVRKLRSEMSETQENGVLTNMGHSDSDTITLKISAYNELMKKLGHAEGQERYLLEYKQDSERKAQELATVKGALDANSSELSEAKRIISRARLELEKIVEIRADAEAKTRALEEQQAELDRLRAENERLRLPWWKKLFLK